jgi:hypothetical protein
MAMAWEIVVGIIMLAVTATVSWYFIPRNGQPHPWVKRPFLEDLIPLSMITGLAFGGTLLLAGLLGG